MAILVQISDWVALLANSLSLVSLGVSVYAAVTITRVRREVAGRATLPAIIAALEESNLILLEMLSDLDGNRRLFEAQLARCEANLRVVLASRNVAAPRARLLAERIERFSLSDVTSSQVDEAWKIHASLVGLIEELRRVSYMQQIGGLR